MITWVRRTAPFCTGGRLGERGLKGIGVGNQYPHLLCFRFLFVTLEAVIRRMYKLIKMVSKLNYIIVSAKYCSTFKTHGQLWSSNWQTWLVHSRDIASSKVSELSSLIKFPGFASSNIIIIVMVIGWLQIWKPHHTMNWSSLTTEIHATPVQYTLPCFWWGGD